MTLTLTYAEDSWRRSVLYHHLSDNSRQVIVSCGAVLEHCVVPPACEPTAASHVQLKLLQPVTLYKCGEHGLGIVAVPQGAARTMRNGIWQLKRAHMNPSLEPFSAALFTTRRGKSGDFDAGSLPESASPRMAQIAQDCDGAP